MEGRNEDKQERSVPQKPRKDLRFKGGEHVIHPPWGLGDTLEGSVSGLHCTLSSGRAGGTQDISLSLPL